MNSLAFMDPKVHYLVHISPPNTKLWVTFRNMLNLFTANFFYSHLNIQAGRVCLFRYPWLLVKYICSYTQYLRWDCEVQRATRYWLETENTGFILVSFNRLFCPLSVRTSSEVHSASYLSMPGPLPLDQSCRSVKLITDFHLVPRLSVSGDIFLY